MDLLNHDKLTKKENTSKKLLTRGPKIEVENQVNRFDIDKKKNDLSKKENSSEHITISTTITEPVNVRVDNHIRNKLSSLIVMGHAESQREMVDMLLNVYIETLDKSDYKRLTDLVKIYEDKDVSRHNKKNKN